MPFDNPYQSSMAGPGPVSSDAKIPTYLVQSILTTCFCCMPFGIVAIVYAAQVDSKQSVGDYEGARRSSDSAKMWCWVSVGVWVAAMVAYVGMFAIFAAVGAQR